MMETGSSWPSSQGLRVRRAIIASRRSGPSTPVPSWNVFNNQLYDGIAVAAGRGSTAPVSARKLAASLWELQDVAFVAPAAMFGSAPLWQSSDTASTTLSQPDLCSYPSPRSTIKLSHEQLSKRGLLQQMSPESRSRSIHHHAGRQVAATRTHVHKLRTDASAYTATMSISLDGQRQEAGMFDNSVTTSTELLKVLSRICILEEQHDSSVSAASSLRVQLDRALACMRELELAHDAAHKEIESLTKKLAQAKSSWKVEQSKLQLVIQSLKEEVENEQKARTRAEAANRKTTKELLDANTAVAKVVQELERERKAHELMEDVCDELAREIGDDKAEVEDLKRDSLKMHEELEEERRMLQLAEVWREERVQMKLGEAKLLLEEKGTALDVLRSELETFLWAAAGSSRKNRGYGSGGGNLLVQEAEVLHNVVAAFHPREIVASYPPAEISRVGFPENNDLLVIRCDKQTECDRYGSHYPSKDTILDLPIEDCGDRWTGGGDSGLWEEEGDTEHQPPRDIMSHGDDSSSDRVVHPASEVDNEDHPQFYKEVEEAVEGGSMEQQHREVCEWKANGVQDGVCVRPLREKKKKKKKNCGHEAEEDEEVVEEVDEAKLHGGQKPEVVVVEWESIPQQSSWISQRNNPHIERGMKGHVLWPKGLIDTTTAAIKKEKAIPS